jgi:hypothetical protein
MTEQSFSLVPFPVPNIPEINIKGKISYQDNLVTLHYSLTGKIGDVFLPSTSMSPKRKDELWKTTCFEFFLAIKDLPQYWEFNLSPSGDWNVYQMDAYRRHGFREEELIQQLQFECQKQEHEFLLEAAANLNPIIPPNKILEAGITTIIQTKNGNETYWALAHPAPYADFHLRESFILAMGAEIPLLRQAAPND